MRPPNRRPFTAYEATVELEFQVSDDQDFLTSESARANCTLVLDEYLPRSSGGALQFVSVYEGRAGQVVSDALQWPGIEDGRLVGRTDDGALVELVVTGPTLASAVLDSRAAPRYVGATRGVATVVVEVPPSTDPQFVVDGFSDRHPDANLVRRREYEPGPSVSESEFRERLLGSLTERQREVFLFAYDAGYFATPKRIDATECAAELGISQSTFSQHLNVALQKVLSALLETSGREPLDELA